MLVRVSPTLLTDSCEQERAGGRSAGGLSVAWRCRAGWSGGVAVRGRGRRQITHCHTQTHTRARALVARHDDNHGHAAAAAAAAAER